MLQQFLLVVQAFLLNKCHNINLKCRDKVLLLLSVHYHNTVSIIAINLQLCSANGLCMIVATKFPLSRQSSVKFLGSLLKSLSRKSFHCHNQKFFVRIENLLL